MNDHQLRSAILASAAYASRQKASTVGERSTCFLAALTGNVVLDAELSSALFTLMGVAEKINAPIHAEFGEKPPRLFNSTTLPPPPPAPPTRFVTDPALPMLSVVCMLAVSFIALAFSLFGGDK